MQPHQRRIEDTKQIEVIERKKEDLVVRQHVVAINRVARMKLNLLIHDLRLLELTPIINGILYFTPQVKSGLSPWPILAKPIFWLRFKFLAKLFEMSFDGRILVNFDSTSGKDHP